MGRGVLLTERAAEVVVDAAQSWETHKGRLGKSGSAYPALDIVSVRCTSSTPDGSGLYSAVVTVRDDAGSWSDVSDTVKVLSPNSEKMVSGVRYDARAIGYASGGESLFQVLRAVADRSSAIVKITDRNITGGYYLGKVMTYNPSSETWVEGEVCRVIDTIIGASTDNFYLDDLIMCVNTGLVYPGSSVYVYMPENAYPLIKVTYPGGGGGTTTARYNAREVFLKRTDGWYVSHDAVTGETTVRLAVANESGPRLIDAGDQDFGSGHKQWRSLGTDQYLLVGPSDIEIATYVSNAAILQVTASGLYLRKSTGGGSYDRADVYVNYGGTIYQGFTGLSAAGLDFVSGICVADYGGSGGAGNASLPMLFLLMGS